jgi:hypothetical protein
MKTYSKIKLSPLQYSSNAERMAKNFNYALERTLHAVHSFRLIIPLTAKYLHLKKKIVKLFLYS